MGSLGMKIVVDEWSGFFMQLRCSVDFFNLQEKFSLKGEFKPNNYIFLKPKTIVDGRCWFL